MNTAVFIIMGICAILYLGTVANELLLDDIRRKRRVSEKNLQEKCVLALSGYLSTGIVHTNGFPFAIGRSRRLKMILARTIATFTAVSYGFDPQTIRDIVTRNGIDTMLLKRIKRSSSWHRIRYMQILSLTGARESVVARIKRFENSKNPYTALFALLVRIGSSPDETISAIREFPTMLRQQDIAEIMMMLRRGFVPIAYEPMVLSDSDNLKLLGIYIIRSFGIEQAEDLLYSMLEHESSEIQDAAIYALATLKSSLTRKNVMECVAAMSFFKRRRLYKFLAAEGYSASSLSVLQSVEQDSRMASYVHEIVNSYKMTLK